MLLGFENKKCRLKNGISKIAFFFSLAYKTSALAKSGKDLIFKYTILTI